MGCTTSEDKDKNISNEMRYKIIGEISSSSSYKLYVPIPISNSGEPIVSTDEIEIVTGEINLSEYSSDNGICLMISGKGNFKLESTKILDMKPFLSLNDESNLENISIGVKTFSIYSDVGKMNLEIRLDYFQTMQTFELKIIGNTFLGWNIYNGSYMKRIKN